MPRPGRRVVAAAIIAGLALGGVAGAAKTRGHQPLALSRALFHDALSAAERGEGRRAMTLYLEAWAADPDFLAPLITLAGQAPSSYPPELLVALDSVALRAGDSLLVACARQLMSSDFRSGPADRFGRSEHARTRRCGAMLASLTDAPTHGWHVWRDLLDSPNAFQMYAGPLARSDPDAAFALGASVGRSDAHAMVRLRGYDAAITALHRMQRHDEAAQWERELDRLAQGWGPGARMEVLRARVSRPALAAQAGAPDSVTADLHRRAADARQQLRALSPLLDGRGRASLIDQDAIELLNSGQLARAASEYRRLIALADTSADRGLAAHAHARRGRALVKLGRHAEARESLLRGRALAEAGGHLIVLREVAHDLLHLYEATGHTDLAVAAGRDFGQYSERAGTMETRMMSHHDLGWLYRRAGNRVAADREFAAMVADIDALGRQYVWAGEYYEHIGDLDRARHYYSLETGQGPERSRTFAGLVRMSEAVGDVERALRYARVADGDTLAWHPEYSLLLPGVLARHGRLHEARDQLRAGRMRAMNHGKVQGFAQLALEAAEVELRLGAAASAAALADSSAAAARRVGAAEIEVRALALTSLAQLEAGGDRSAAMARLRSAVARGARMRIPQLSAALHSIMGDALRRLGDVRAALRQYATAAEWVDSIALRLRSDADRATYLDARVRVSNRAIAAIVQDLGLDDRPRAYASWSARRKGRGGAAGSAAVERGRKRLDRQTAVIDFSVLDTLVAALVLTSDGATVHRLPVTADSLRERVARFLAPIAPRVGSAVDLTRLAFDSAAAVQLYRDLIEPVRGAIGARDQLIVVPDGVLHSIPFDALLTGDRRRFLIDDHTVRYAMALDGGLRDGPAGTRPGLIVLGSERGRDAGGAAEVAAVARILGRDVTTVHGMRATSAALERSSAWRLLHFAAHAEANDVNPDYARLALRDEEGEGWLHAFEIRELRLDGALVVLSACQTAAGRVVGEGTLSLSRAFLQAGAAATIATLWPVGEPTTHLMSVFYRRLEAEGDVGNALRAARLALRRAGHDHPFYWAPFILTLR